MLSQVRSTVNCNQAVNGIEAKNVALFRLIIGQHDTEAKCAYFSNLTASREVSSDCLPTHLPPQVWPLRCSLGGVYTPLGAKTSASKIIQERRTEVDTVASCYSGFCTYN